MQWYELLNDSNKEMLEAFYDKKPDLKSLNVTRICLDTYGMELSIRLYLPFPDKEIQKWKINQFNSASIILRFSDVHEIKIAGDMNLSITGDINIQYLGKENIVVEMISTNLKCNFKCTAIWFDKIHGSTTDKE